MTPTPINFGDLGIYSSGQFVPDGDYAAFFNVIMHQAVDKANTPKGPRRLGVMVDYFPLATPTEDHKIQQFYSLGSKADQSFAPNPVTGKGVVPIPGASGGGLNDKTNWSFLLRSLYDSGLPQGIFTNDLSSIDGVHVHIASVDEPEERASYQSNTAEVAAAPRQRGKIAVVTEIKENGKPWEGTGGLPGIATGIPAQAKAAKVNGSPVPASAPPTANLNTAIDAEEVAQAAIIGVSSVIEKKATGCMKSYLRTETFKIVKSKYSDDMANRVTNMYFEGDGSTLLTLLGGFGYTVTGSGAAAMVRPEA